MNAIDLQAWRASRGWAADYAARYLGASIATYRNWEAGRRSPPDMLDRLIDVLSIVEALAPEIHTTLLPGPPEPHKRRGRKPAAAA